ncbi:hypothetical protein D0Z00_002187 [Geotrichum galactomycetum]|uniref:Uncharacterized protein n=1 Tax=Geotrichum galactomycetum TaxID=27317 RepID=A0ACB6V4V6_9ASCO|nr:hypothetical protein D0Z00_002187 [Geotrichum candidum]
MSFSFGFSGDDIDDTNSAFVSSANGNSVIDYKTSLLQLEMPASIQPPQKHDVKGLLMQSLGVRMSYDIDSPSIPPRRDLFDVKHQLMSQDNLTETEQILLGLTNEDLRVAKYEGGLKSWECTFDLIDVLEKKTAGGKIYSSVIELGCGTALPSAALFKKMLQQPAGAQTPRRLVLADYNESVLKLVTVPNLLFTWYELQDKDQLLQALQTPKPGSELHQNTKAENGEVDITEPLIDAFVASLNEHNINLEFISGGWSKEFVQLLAGTAPFDLLLASETIYSPETLPVFTDTMLNLMAPQTEALVAAKRVYFGVGGGIPEFERCLDQRAIKYESILDVTSGGVVRGVLEVLL